MMYYDDHNPPHFHAKYNEYQVIFDISKLEVINGNFPTKALSLVKEWAVENQEELLQNWNLAVNGEKLNNIKPL